MSSSNTTAHTTPIIAIRAATDNDAAAIHRLAALDSAPRVPAGPMLVGVVDGEILAAIPVSGGRAVADPFAPTAELVAHLDLRAARLRACTTDRGARRLVRPAVRRARSDEPLRT